MNEQEGRSVQFMSYPQWRQHVNFADRIRARREADADVVERILDRREADYARWIRHREAENHAEQLATDDAHARLKARREARPRWLRRINPWDRP